MTSIAIIAILLYLFASIRFATPAKSQARKFGDARAQALALLVAALGAHAALLYATVLSNGAIDLGVFNAASLTGWCIGIAVLLILVFKPVDSLVVAVFPTIACVVGIASLFPARHTLAADAALGLQLHIIFSIVSYALFAIAAVQAVYIGVADFKLRQHRPIMDFLPPLPTMEKILFQLTGLAFVLLSISLLLGAMYISDIQAQHLSHKILFSLLAWIIFAVLLVGRWRFGWRGLRAIKFVLVGFALLALGFFGSKVVLELVLRRV